MRKLLLALALVGGLTTPVLAQSVTQNTLTGNESWNAGQGPGGPGAFITSDLVRNSSRPLVGTIPEMTGARCPYPRRSGHHQRGVHDTRPFGSSARS